MNWICSSDGENHKCKILVDEHLELMDDTSMYLRETGIMKSTWET
jgi:hypothetical protein